MTLEQDQAKHSVCQDCDHTYEYKEPHVLDICMSCNDRRAVERDARQFKKAQKHAYWVNPNKFRTYDPERTQSLDATRKAYVFEEGGYVRTIERIEGEWVTKEE